MDLLGLVIFGAVAIVLLGLLIWGTRNPLVWWVLCVLATGTGTCLLVWGILLYSHQEELPFASPALVIGAGAGSLAASIVLLVAAIVGSCSRRRHQA